MAKATRMKQIKPFIGYAFLQYFFLLPDCYNCIKLPWELNGIAVNVAMIAILLVTLYYLWLSPALGAGMFLFGLLNLFVCNAIEQYSPLSLWLVCIIVFVLAWIGQFYGHHIEGKKPSFLKDIQFLLIGPMWLMSFIYIKLGIGFKR